MHGCIWGTKPAVGTGRSAAKGLRVVGPPVQGRSVRVRVSFPKERPGCAFRLSPYPWLSALLPARFLTSE